ncbi:MAG: ABC transporter permease [Nitrospirae bacterium]|nr:ABC transporter permease [Nitrospirota bacterium]
MELVKKYYFIFQRRIKKLLKLLPPLLTRDIKERYAGSVFGLLWTFIQPMLFIILYWLVFAQILKIRINTDTGEIPFFAFMLSGILPWFAFQDGVFRGASSIIDKRHIIKKLIFPIELFPLSSVISSFIHYGVGIILFITGYFIWKGEASIIQVIFIIILICIQIILATGLSLLLASLSVYMRDIIHILGVVLQVIFYMSTILYPLSAVPESLKPIIMINPLTALTEAYHDSILYGKYPETAMFYYLILTTFSVFILGVYVFRKLKKGFADVL